MIVWSSCSHASSEAPLEVARVLLGRGARSLLLLDASRGASPGVSYLYIAPEVVLTGALGGFYEVGPGGERVVVDDPVAWLRAEGEWTLAGALAFEFAWALDAPRGAPPDRDTPDLYVGRYLCGASFDHAAQTWTVHGPATHPAYAELEAAILAAMASPAPPALAAPPAAVRLESPRADAYRAGVAACVEAIWAGEAFEINYTARWSARWEGEALALYEALRAVASGEYFALLAAEGLALASVSPERFLSIEGGVVHAKPIKGSRRRSADPEEDAAQAAALLGSAKDRAENVMIVDLMRNDLTRVCVPGTVRVPALCALESFAGIHHLVSTVEGQLAPQCRPIDALLASFPAGSIVGAPKLRAMELIRDLECGARGFYTGTIFHARGDRLEASVLIRTATRRASGRLEYGAGGAVVSDSAPEDEWQEARLKLWPLVRALGDISY
jgi:para-aminobenzoate synthetase component 1